MRCLGARDTTAFVILNSCTAFISLLTAVYLLPLVPNLMSTLDEGLQDLIRLNNETEDSRSQLLTFMAFLCHEIRNPLFAITSTITFMEDSHLTEEQGLALRSIGQSTNLMLRLVNDVLDISKLESGKIEFEDRDFDFREMAHNVAATTETQIKHNPNVQFKFQISLDVPTIVVGDSVRIMQILYNLLSNAVKFTEKGEVKFDVSAMPYDVALKEGVVEKRVHVCSKKGISSTPVVEGDDSDLSSQLLQAVEEGFKQQIPLYPLSDYVVVKVAVADTGSGIAPERMKQIFTPYSQKLSDYRKHGGTGLGLSIITKILRIMGGSIQVQSEEEHGATFSVHLPLRVSQCQSKDVTDDCRTVLCESLNSLRLPDIVSPISQKHSVSCLESNPSSCATDPTFSHGNSSAIGARKSVVYPSGHNDCCSSLPYTLSRAPVLDGIPVVPLLSISLPSDPRAHRKRELPKFNLPPNDKVVLVVDDNILNRKLLGRMLSHFNLDCRFACNGEEAIQSMTASRVASRDPQDPLFALIIMDLSMPVMDGCEATTALRRKGFTLPIIVLSANAIDGSRDDAFKAGATEFLTKPILREDLYTKCFKYLSPSLGIIND